MWRNRLHKNQKGLTLVELLVVTAILAIMATITAGAVSGTTGKGRSASKDTDTNEVQKAVDRFRSADDYTNYPVDKTAGEVWALTFDSDTGKVATATKIASPTLTSKGLPSTSGQYIALKFDAATSPASGETSQTFQPDILIRLPRHASDTVTVPASNGDSTVPAWVIGSDGAVVSAWPDETY